MINILNSGSLIGNNSDGKVDKSSSGQRTGLRLIREASWLMDCDFIRHQYPYWCKCQISPGEWRSATCQGKGNRSRQLGVGYHDDSRMIRSKLRNAPLEEEATGSNEECRSTLTVLISCFNRACNRSQDWHFRDEYWARLGPRHGMLIFTSAKGHHPCMSAFPPIRNRLLR